MSWKDKNTNVWVLDKIGTDLTIRRGIMERKLKYFGHIVRRSEGVEKQILQGAVEGKWGRGRPPISWTDDIKRVSGQGMIRCNTNGRRKSCMACSREDHSRALQRHLKLIMMRDFRDLEKFFFFICLFYFFIEQ